MTIRILLVEDDTRLADSVMQFFELHQMVADTCLNGQQALTLLEQNQYDVIVCDVNMPKMNGLELCQKIRQDGLNTPFIFVTANDHIDDKLLGFDKGADDYLTKPFEMRELFARVNSLSNRRSSQATKLKIDELSLLIDFDQRAVFRQEQPIKLTPYSWKMLTKLAKSYPHPVSKNDLAFAIWGEDLPDSDSLKVHVHHLRKSLDKPFDFPIVQAVSGFGFRLARK